MNTFAKRNKGLSLKDITTFVQLKANYSDCGFHIWSSEVPGGRVTLGEVKEGDIHIAVIGKHCHAVVPANYPF